MMVKKHTVQVAMVIGILLVTGFVKAQSKSKDSRFWKVYEVDSEQIAKAIFDLFRRNEDVVHVNPKNGRIHVLATEKVHKFVDMIIQEFVIEKFESKDAIRFLLAQIAELRQRVTELEELHEKGRIKQ